MPLYMSIFFIFQNLLGKVNKCKMPMIQGRLHRLPLCNIADKLVLIVQRKYVTVGCYVHMKHVKIVLFAKIVGNPNKTCRSSFRDAVVNHHQIFSAAQRVGFIIALEILIVSFGLRLF